jgi:hypothetical protein
MAIKNRNTPENDNSREVPMWHSSHPADYGLTQLVTNAAFGNVPKITEPQCSPYLEFLQVRLFWNRSSDLGS